MKNKIRHWRRMKDITQIELARRIGCSHSWIHIMEKNYYQPDKEFMTKIAKALQMSEKELFG